jgi:hypothetical protein
MKTLDELIRHVVTTCTPLREKIRVEIQGRTYASDDVERVREQFLYGLKIELEGLQMEKELLASHWADSEDGICSDISNGEISDKIDAVEANIAELENYKF